MGMTIDGLVNNTNIKDGVATLVLNKALYQDASQVQQLLRALPPAPSPAHLGSQFNTLA